MEKLILRSVMYGADKIPDSWFERIPGGYYRSKDGKQTKAQVKHDLKESSESRPGSSGRESGRRRRHSTGEKSRGPPPPPEDDYHEDDHHHHRSRRHGDDRASYDGVDDDAYSGDDRRRRRNHSSTRRRRRSFDNERDGHEDGHGRPPRVERFDYPRVDHRQAPPPQQAYPPVGRTAPRDPAAVGAAAGAAAAMHAGAPRGPPYPQTAPVSPNPMSPPPPVTSSGSTGVSNGYVPYAHIYGHSDQASTASRQPFSSLPQSSNSTVKPNRYSQMSPPVAPQPYQQNPYIPHAQTAAAAGASYNNQFGDFRGRDTYVPPYDERHYGPSYDDRYNGYDQRGRSISQSPPRHRQSRRKQSPSDDSYSNDHDSRAERRGAEPKRSKSHGGRGKSQLGERFDTSKKGMGYGLVGAVAGGLVGSELGSGAIPTAIGAAVGALGANAFEARERYVPPPSTTTTSPPYQFAPTPVDPRKPLRSQLAPPRRKEDSRNANDKKKSSGHHSD